MKKKKWTHSDIEFLKNNMGKRTIEDIAEKLNRSPRAVQLFALRKRWSWSPVVKFNLILKMLEVRFGHPEYFKPNRAFYKAVNINQVRFWRLYRGESSPTESEYTALRKHFNITKDDMNIARQLDIFQNKETQSNNTNL